MLAPLGWLYGLGAAMRREAYARGAFRPGRLVSPVISVGGLAMGGSMKTSLVLEIARALQNRGGEVGIIGHGYRGRADAARLVSDGDTLFETACSVGDEAVLVSTDLKRCPVVESSAHPLRRRRASPCRRARRRSPGHPPRRVRRSSCRAR